MTAYYRDLYLIYGMCSKGHSPITQVQEIPDYRERASKGNGSERGNKGHNVSKYRHIDGCEDNKGKKRVCKSCELYNTCETTEYQRLHKRED